MGYGDLFLDESGQLGAATKAGMNIVALVAGNVAQIKQIMVRARKRFPKAGMVGKEYKATKAPKEVTRYILEELARCDCEIVVLMVGQVDPLAYGGDMNELYAAAVVEIVARVWENHPDARPVLHQRYDNVVLRDRITTLLIAKAREMGIKLDREEVQHRRAMGEYGLEVVDAVAWSVTQWRRKNRRAANLYEIIRDKVVVQEFFGKKAQ